MTAIEIIIFTYLLFIPGITDAETVPALLALTITPKLPPKILEIFTKAKFL